MDENNPFDDTNLLNTFLLASVISLLNDVTYKLTMVQKTIRERPEIFNLENAFDLNVAISKFLEDMGKVRRSEIKRVLEENPEIRESLIERGIDPDAI